MLSRHSNELMLRLEQVNDLGCAVIRKAEMMRWYNCQRTSVTVWRDLNQKWQELLEALEHKGECELFIAEGDAEYILIWGEGLMLDPDTPKDAGWFEPLTKWAKAA